MLDYWEEGIDLAAFYGAFALAALRGRLGEERETLLSVIAALRPRSRTLWQRTYAPASVELELVTRYGLHEACLGSGSAAVLHRIADPVQPPYRLVDATERPFGSFGSFGSFGVAGA
jgi:hypothetical protein